ncbi:MAG: phosphopantetheine-binding protein, partial [Planctomycetota bacterium]
PESETIAPATPRQPSSESQADSELESLLIEVVAEKTGYPQSAIDVNLDLEADLGIDSIKRVEILSALRQHRPDLEALPAETLGSLRTISSIVDHYSGTSGAQPIPKENPAPAVATPALADSSPAQPSKNDSLGVLLIEVIAEKTGYPADAIGIDLDLEADLGIDSIKRVEILSALRQHRPDLQALPAETLGSLRSIAAIINHYGESSHAPSVGSGAATPIVSSQPAAAGPPPKNEDPAGLTQLMVDVIAEKTGYPSDSIGTDLDLEADLGIDSIKRVEILSALRQVDPNLPTLPPEQLGSLRTIDQLVNALGGSSPAPRNSVVEDSNPTSTIALPSTEETHSPVAGDSLETLLLDVIAEKTGYPSEAIGTDLDLEADLGIDSIKRVEILSALRQHRPDLTAIPADQLGSLRSISDIAGWYSGGDPENAGHAPLQTDSVQPKKLEPVADLPLLNFAVTATTPLAARDTETQRILDTELDWWVIGNDPLVREQIVEELTERGVNARPWSLRDFDQVSPHQHEISGFVLIGSAEPQASEPIELFRWLRVAGQCLRHHPQGLSSAHFVTRLGGNWGNGNNSQHDPLGGALLGLARCAVREWSDFIVRGIDLDHNGIDQGTVGREIVAEIFHGDETFVGLGRHGRQGWSLNPISPPAEQRVPIESGDLIVVTGGARGVTAECLDALTRVCSPALYLLGRTPEPGNEPEWAVGVADADLESRLFALGTGSRTPAEVRKEANMIRQSREIQGRIKDWQSEPHHQNQNIA